MIIQQYGDFNTHRTINDYRGVVGPSKTMVELGKE